MDPIDDGVKRCRFVSRCIQETWPHLESKHIEKSNIKCTFKHTFNNILTYVLLTYTYIYICLGIDCGSRIQIHIYHNRRRKASLAFIATSCKPRCTTSSLKSLEPCKKNTDGWRMMWSAALDTVQTKPFSKWRALVVFYKVWGHLGCFMNYSLTFSSIDSLAIFKKNTSNCRGRA